MRVLVINCGSSSVKFHLYDMEGEQVLLSGAVERIGEKIAHCVFNEYLSGHIIKTQQQNIIVLDHPAALARIFSFLQNNLGADLGTSKTIKSIDVIAHRVVHGGESYHEPTLINASVRETLADLIPLAPLHNPANISGIDAALQCFTTVPQVAVFDTAFFHTLPSHAYRYALPNYLYHQHGVRRYGFHGISHQFVAQQAAAYIQKPLDKLRLITLHLGNGASIAAIRNGQCIDTSMGMTPLEGLVMGTRCGDIDPSIPIFLAGQLGMGTAEIETLLNRASGLRGLCGANDMREVYAMAERGDERALLALEIYAYRISKYIGAYFVALGGLDTLIFTGGVGEHRAGLRAAVCKQLTVLGIELDEDRNRLGGTGTFPINIGGISGPSAMLSTVLVISSNEALAIARQAQQVIVT